MSFDPAAVSPTSSWETPAAPPPPVTQPCTPVIHLCRDIIVFSIVLASLPMIPFPVVQDRV